MYVGMYSRGNTENYAFGLLRSIYVNLKYYQRGKGLSPQKYQDSIVV